VSDSNRRDWWQLVEEHLDAADADEQDAAAAVDDPWGDGSAAPPLTDAQRALLAGIDDQPHVPRVTEPDHAPDDQPPVPRLARHPETAPDRDEPGGRAGNMPGDSE
jgi:hypothetical protein